MSADQFWKPWQAALESYRYRADLTQFTDRHDYNGWFLTNLAIGDRHETSRFEDSFRLHAPYELAAWFEVIFWKVPYPWKEGITQKVIERVRSRGVSPKCLWDACCQYIHEPSQKTFGSFQALLVATSSLAVCATFPAFIEPARFPMIDTRIAKWVMKCHEEHNLDNAIRLVVPPRYNGTKSANVLTMADFPFVGPWTSWCRSKAKILTDSSGFEWRARDVEMAIFEAWGGKNVRQHPKRKLPAIRPTFD